MGNPLPPKSSLASKLSGLFQIVSDTKWATKSFAIGVVASQTDFFLAGASADPTIDNYDAGGQLVTSDKSFVIQALASNIISTSIADVDAFIQKGIVILTCQQKEVGRFRLRHLNAAGGTFVAGAQVAAASSVGVISGNPGMDPWTVGDILVSPNMGFKVTLCMPQGALAYTAIAATTVELDLIGYEARPAS